MCKYRVLSVSFMSRPPLWTQGGRSRFLMFIYLTEAIFSCSSSILFLGESFVIIPPFSFSLEDLKPFLALKSFCHYCVQSICQLCDPICMCVCECLWIDNSCRILQCIVAKRKEIGWYIEHGEANKNNNNKNSK